jgi:PmbA protein
MPSATRWRSPEIAEHSQRRDRGAPAAVRESRIEIVRNAMAATADGLDLLTDLVAKARAAGADSADAVFVDGTSLQLALRLGKTEKLDRAEGRDVGLRVFIGRRQAVVSSSDVSPAALAELVERAVAMAKAVPEDPFAGLAEPELLARAPPDLDTFDPGEPSAEALTERARRAEEAARAVPGVTNSEGAEAGWGASRVALAASNGFAEARAGSWHSLSVSVLAGEGTAMERDYDYRSCVFGADLPTPESIGRSAGERAVKRLNPRKIPSDRVPVLYEPRVAGSLLSHLASAINGAAVARGTTFLKDRLGKPVFAAGVAVVDDPLRRRGLRSRAFDGEGVSASRRNVVDKGVLTTWILDLRSARQLGLATTGHAARGTSGPPSPSVSNFYLEAGRLTREELIADVQRGFLATELIGFGVNGVTGDYSRGASGFWIENGQLAYPVSEVTVAGNLKDMFLELTPASDLEFRYGTDSPTLRVDGMTVAGR